MGPVEGCAQRLVPGRGRPGTTRQHVEYVAEPLGELSDRQDAHPGGGQLDGKGQAVQLAAELCHLGPVGVGDREVRCDEPCPVAEELNRLLLVKRRYRPGPLAFDAERLAAGGEDGKSGALGEQVLGQGCGCFGEVLAVVEDDQDLLVAAGGQVGGDGFRRVRARRLRHAEPGGHGRGDDVRVVERRELDPGDVDRSIAGAVAVGQRGGCREREPRLAGAARPGERQQAALPGRAGDRGQLRVPAHQRRQPHGKPSGGQHCHLVSPPAC